MRALWTLGFVIGTVGCGGGSPPPESATASPLGSVSAPIASAAPTSTGPTLKSVACQALVDLPKLQPYFHLEVPERKKTIAIVRGSACDGEALAKPGAQVTFVDAKTPEAKFALEILEYVPATDTSRVMMSFRLEGEGVLGQAVIEVSGAKATIVRETVAEK